MLSGAWGSSPRSAGRVLRLRGRLLADLRRALPASDPARYPVFVGDRNCPERHGPRVAVPSTWKRRRPLLCVSPGLLAPAACRVPGGLIKFDLFFPRQSILPPSPLARRPLLCPLRPWGVSDCLSACAQLRAKPGTQNGGGVFLSCKAAGGGHPRLLPRCFGPEFTPEVPPEPPPFRILGAGG